MLLTLGDLAFNAPARASWAEISSAMRSIFDAVFSAWLRRTEICPTSCWSADSWGADGAPLGLQRQVPLLQRLLEGLSLAIEAVQRVVLLGGG